MYHIGVLLTGPWWHDLCYECVELPPIGARVVVPVANGIRVGICTGVREKEERIKTREVIRVLDDFPVVSAEYLAASERVSKAFLCSQSEVLRSLLPSIFWKGGPFERFCEAKRDKNAPAPEFLYSYSDSERFDRYREEILSCNGGVICLFSEGSSAALFRSSLKGVIPSERLVSWPNVGGKTAWRAWDKALSCENAVVIGAPFAAAAPLKNPSLIIIDEECSPSYRTRAYPCFSLRSFAVARGRVSGARVIMGGRMPSSSVFANARLDGGGMPREKAYTDRIVSLNGIPKIPFRGIKFPLAMSDAVISETLSHVSGGETVFWLLDRRGETSCLKCDDCGREILCQCGHSVVLEHSKLRCMSCGKTTPAPERCPSCGGYLIKGMRPGLEALRPFAERLLRGAPVFLWHQDSPSKASEKKSVIKTLNERGGLVIGSRCALSLLDRVKPALLCWLDADAETRQPSYRSKSNAYSMFLESCCRGGSKRDVIFQTRNPSGICIKSVSAGWRRFWVEELNERAELGFPPLSYMAEITLPNGWADSAVLSEELADAGFTPLASAESADTFTVLMPHIAPLRRVLQKYFEINRSRNGFPSIRVYID